MNKKILLSTLGGTVALFLLGGLIYGLLLADYMAEQMEVAKACTREELPMALIVLANAVQALLLAIVLDKFGISTLKSGAIAATWITLLMAIWFELWIVISFNFMTPNLIVMDIVLNTIMGAVAGAVIGLILGKVK